MAQERIDMSNADGSTSGFPISSTFNNFRVPSTLIVTPNNEVTFVTKDNKKVVYPATSKIKIVDKQYNLGVNKDGQLFNDKGETIDWGTFPLDALVVSQTLEPTKMAEKTSTNNISNLIPVSNANLAWLIGGWALFGYVAKTNWNQSKSFNLVIITFGALNIYNTYNTFKK